jgi:hypothetical protein
MVMTQRAQSIVGYSQSRAENDFYPTPAYVTTDILEREKFTGSVWEPACGDGAMSRVIELHGYQVISSDLFDRGYGETGIDFLLENRKVGNIITNPPFLLAEKFVKHALEYSEGKVCMFLKLAFLEGAARKVLFQSTPLARVYVYSKRVSLQKDGVGKTGSGMIAFAWFVWEHGYKGDPAVRWI